MVEPKQGNAIYFVQRGKYDPQHEGSIHKNEAIRKYIIRTDVDYTKVIESNADPNCVLL